LPASLPLPSSYLVRQDETPRAQGALRLAVVSSVGLSRPAPDVPDDSSEPPFSHDKTTL
jgi:hypothetical protein